MVCNEKNAENPKWQSQIQLCPIVGNKKKSLPDFFFVGEEESPSLASHQHTHLQRLMLHIIVIHLCFFPFPRTICISIAELPDEKKTRANELIQSLQRFRLLLAVIFWRKRVEDFAIVYGSHARHLWVVAEIRIRSRGGKKLHAKTLTRLQR